MSLFFLAHFFLHSRCRILRRLISLCPVNSSELHCCDVCIPCAGDVLLSVNGMDLTGVTRGEAVANLKNTSSPVVLKVLEMRPPEEGLPEDTLLPCLANSPADSTKSPLPNDDYSPQWVSWLQLPRWAPPHLHYSHFIFWGHYQLYLWNRPLWPLPPGVKWNHERANREECSFSHLNVKNIKYM